MVQRLLRASVLVLAGLLVLVALVVAAYVLGRSQCPPPGWWVAVFAVDGNYGCVR